MRAGKLDRRITIQRRTVTLSDRGTEVETWADIAYRIPAGYAPMTGEERFGSDQWVAAQQCSWQIRWSTVLSAVTPLDRIIYPSTSQNVQAPAFNTVYNIMGVAEVGRRRGLSIKTARRADVTA